jgi:hypothetical protein
MLCLLVALAVPARPHVLAEPSQRSHSTPPSQLLPLPHHAGAHAHSLHLLALNPQYALPQSSSPPSTMAGLSLQHSSLSVACGMAAQAGMTYPNVATWVRHHTNGATWHRVVGKHAWRSTTGYVGNAGMCGVAEVRTVVRGWMDHNSTIIQL